MSALGGSVTGVGTWTLLVRMHIYDTKCQHSNQEHDQPQQVAVTHQQDARRSAVSCLNVTSLVSAGRRNTRELSRSKNVTTSVGWH